MQRTSVQTSLQTKVILSSHISTCEQIKLNDDEFDKNVQIESYWKNNKNQEDKLKYY